MARKEKPCRSNSYNMSCNIYRPCFMCHMLCMEAPDQVQLQSSAVSVMVGRLECTTNVNLLAEDVPT
jgi:hypothetical protein